MAARGKLLLAGIVIVCVTAYMAYLGASASWQYYLTVNECLARGEKFVGSRIRVSGVLAGGTLRVDPERTRASFQLLGSQRNLTAACAGPLPDNLKENMPVVVEGQLDDVGVLHGSKVLTRCASKYESRPLDEAQTAARPTGTNR